MSQSSTLAGTGARLVRMRPSKRSALLVDGVIFVAISAIVLASGFSAARSTAYWSTSQIFGDFMNSPVRLLFPVLVALSAGLGTAAELGNHFVASTRTREDVRGRMAKRFFSVAVRAFVIFALVTIECGIAAFVIVPALHLATVDPGGYNLHGQAAVFRADVALAPLAALEQYGWWAVVAAAAAWFGANAAAFALVTALAVVFIHRAVLALLVPLALYLVESVIFQVAGLPGASFLLSAAYPSGLQHYDFIQALVPTVVLLAAAITTAVIVAGTARTAARFS